MTAAMHRRSGAAPEQGNHRQDAAQLTGLIRDCRLADIARNAVVVRLSRLPADKLRPHHIRLARAALEPLVHADRARVFELPSRDLVAVWRGAADVARTTSHGAILHMFIGDDSFPIAPERLWEEYQLPGDADGLLAVARPPEEQAFPARVQAVSVPLDPASLATFETELARADVARFARRHPVALAQPQGGFRLAWEKRKLDIGELAGCLSPRHDLKADPWLFRRLTRTLDRRMLALLAAPGELAEAGPFAINLNVASILGPEFLRLDSVLPTTLRGRVTLDLAPEDVLADPAAYVFARDFARARGYRLALHGMTGALLPVLPVRSLGLDLLYLRWSEELRAFDLAALQVEPAHVLLGRTDTLAALEWGSAQGIGLFSGKLVSQARRASRMAPMMVS
jgi:hypothetical protein